ncbi:MAG: enoyl-CoA hydratase/isomerase family protein [Pseudorhodobacter sp.]|nr:enoyl-CoA hydratase/isomerase family protein [Pseudorhodobacter sp.]
MTDDILLRHDAGPVTTLTLNAPASLNALSTAMLTRLAAELTTIAASTQRVVILRAVGKAFSAGHDLKEIQALRTQPDQGRAAFTHLFTLCADVMQQIAHLPQPVIAQVHAIAAAAGCQLVASCDMVVAADTARFGINGVNIGLYCHTPLVALSQKIPRAHAVGLASTGNFLTVYEAQALGLVTRITSPGNMDGAGLELAQTLAQKLPSALAAGKRAAAPDLAAAYTKATDAMVDNLLNPDTDEGISAFLAKRPPAWAV